jgi:hypothetical protein
MENLLEQLKHAELMPVAGDESADCSVAAEL